MGKTAAPEARRRLSADERRARILKAGTEVFAERGYAGASMVELASRGGVVASVIYDHFESKRELFVELLELHGGALIERSITAIDFGTPETMMRASIEAFYRLVEEDPFAWRFLFRDPPAEPEIEAVWRRIHDRATAGIAALVEAGAPDGDWAGDLAPSAAAWMLAKASQGATNSLAAWWFEHREVSRRQVTDLATRLLWEGTEGMLAGAVRR